jgi:peptidoglycan/LPS O-acetylase OafA/YrhL
MATAWAVAVVVAGRARALHFGVPQAVATFFGFAPWIGPSYFVTVVLQLVIVLPAILFFYQRVGALATLLGTLAITVVSEGLFGQVITAGNFVFGGLVHNPGWFYFLIFGPRFVWAVAGGIFISRRWDARPPAKVVALAVAVTAAGFAAVAAVPPNTYGGALEQQMVAYAVDVPLALTLLGLFRYLAPLRGLTAFLGWCGRWSWGIYLGHVLVLEVVFLLGAAPQNGTNLVRGIYWLALFAAGGTLALGADAANRVTGRLVSSLAGARER